MPYRRADSARAVAAWLAVVAGLVTALILLGGLVRITGSGLSIVEWDLVAGILPPLSQAGWESAFAAYRQSPEYAAVNAWMEISDFRWIFWWEWAHRFLGRLTGVAYVVPLVVFACRGALHRDWRGTLLLLLALGTIQGGVGWWMVWSGLIDRPHVSPYLLALHLGLAFVMLGLLLDLIQRVRLGERRMTPAPGTGLVSLLVGLVLLQVVLGAFVAGTGAGRVFNEWPLMGGSLLPPALLELQPFWRSLFEDPGIVQFAHRMLAYLVLLTAIALAWRVGGARTWTISALVAAQLALGIATLLAGVPPALAAAHQWGAVAVYASAVLLRDRLLRSN